MNTSWEDRANLTNEERLVHETKFYQQLSDKMVIEWDMSHWYTWSLWWKGRARQIFIHNQKEKPLNSTELGILAISLSLREGRDRQERFALWFFLQTLWIVNADDIADFASEMIKNTRWEHAVKSEYLKNCTENTGKIIILRRAYEELQKERSQCKLKNSEDRIILWYVIALLGGIYEFRPYMIDRELQTESWVDVYDHLFDNFSEKSAVYYKSEWYESLYSLFLSIRNEILEKKRLKQIAQHECSDLIQKVKRDVFVWRRY